MIGKTDSLPCTAHASRACIQHPVLYGLCSLYIICSRVTLANQVNTLPTNMSFFATEVKMDVLGAAKDKLPRKEP